MPLPNTDSTGRLTASLEARRALSSCKTEMMVSLEDLEVPGHRSTSSGGKQQPWGLRAGRQGEEEEQRLPAGCALPPRGRLSSCCSRLVPCHRSGSLVPGDSGQEAVSPASRGRARPELRWPLCLTSPCPREPAEMRRAPSPGEDDSRGSAELCGSGRALRCLALIT